MNINHAGIPQGSPMSPVLYVVYNSALVRAAIGTKGGAIGFIGFIDDFNAWVTGPDEDENTKKIEETVIPRVEAWSRASGATFKADKTAFVHFSYRAARAIRPQGKLPLHFKGREIVPQSELRVLGVTLDRELRMDAHIAKVVAAGTARCIELASR